MKEILTTVAGGVLVWVIVEEINKAKARKQLAGTQNTFVGSEQTEMLRDQDSDFFDELDTQSDTIYQ